MKAREEDVAVRMAVRESFVPEDPLHSSIVKDDESPSVSLPSSCIDSGQHWRRAKRHRRKTKSSVVTRVHILSSLNRRRSDARPNPFDQHRDSLRQLRCGSNAHKS